MDTIKDIMQAISQVIKMFFSNDMDVMSDEVKEIMSNPEDREKYLDAVRKLGTNGHDEIVVKLSNKTFTLTT